jgi:hypothetical protein
MVDAEAVPEVRQLRRPEAGGSDGALVNFGPYSLKNFRQLLNGGRDGDVRTAVLYRDGKKLDQITDDGNGGPIRHYLRGEAEAELLAYVATLPPEPDLQPGSTRSFKVDVDYFLGSMLERAAVDRELAKHYRRMKKSGAVFAVVELPSIRGFRDEAKARAEHAAALARQKNSDEVRFVDLRGTV